MLHDWREFLQKGAAAIDTLGDGNLGIIKGIAALAQAQKAKKALDDKTRELIALAVAATTRCDTCIAVHADSAIKAGVTRDELLEALAVAVSLNAGPAMIYSSHILDAYDQFAKEPKA